MLRQSVLQHFLCLACFIASCLFSVHLYAIEKEKIVVGTDVWVGVTNEDGTGTYLELLYEIYGKENLEINFMPFNRVIDSFNKGAIDIAIGLFRDDVDRAIFPNWYLDIEYPIIAIYNKERHTINKASDLKDLNLSWMRGYGFGRYLPEAKNIYQLTSVWTGFEMLMKGRIDALIDYPYNIPEHYSDKLAAFELIPERYIFNAFQKNLHGKKLAERYDKRMAQMRDDGTLKQLFKAEYQRSNFESFNPNKETMLIFTDEAGVFYSHKEDSVELSNRLSSSLNLIFDQMIHYHVEYKLVRDFSNITDYAQQENTCFSDMIKTPEREKRFIFSKPTSLYLGMALHSAQPLAIEGDAQLSELATYLPDYKLGLVNGRSYGEILDQQISQVPLLNVFDVPAEVDKIAKLLARNRFDLVIEYPQDIHYYWEQYSDKPLYSYPIAGAEPYILGHFMCSNTPSGRAFIEAVNQSLRKLNASSVLYNQQQEFIAPSQKAIFEKYFNMAMYN
ncbi:transporter substrate-binding domain-containing protein [Thalassotalea sp. LPB0316]|uniref:transporter substrate-binding domain-containing protein n=1 Tax=Thalassotalea sp. LPB0316 TaxID=2769490 RepID=UPI0018687B43|nr:transporter substrate-binding domain-containing protein [Thalassotalea sp. LPB0316]QOL26834.1 transporter substrate-binding domain-containing protein [Thalassotalea sp. LPB0316]